MNTIKSSSSSSVGKIDKVDSTTAFHQSTDGKWISIFKAISPLSHFAEAYAKTLAYKIETKRLDVELSRIGKQAEIANNVIDKTFRLKLEELEQRRVALIGFYTTVNKELERLHIERLQVLKIVELVTEKTLEPGIDIEERRLYKEMAIEISSQLPNFGSRANESLKTLVQALPPAQLPVGLLSDNSPNIED